MSSDEESEDESEESEEEEDEKKDIQLDLSKIEDDKLDGKMCYFLHYLIFFVLS